jgi:hypothetical protein
MAYEHITSLLTPADTKIVMLVMDGLGGIPMQAGGLTELEKRRLLIWMPCCYRDARPDAAG